MRRLLEVFERQNTAFHTYWSKAFDSVTFTAIQTANGARRYTSPHPSGNFGSMQYPNLHRPRLLSKILPADPNQRPPARMSTITLPLQSCTYSPFYDVQNTYQNLYGEISGVFSCPLPLWALVCRRHCSPLLFGPATQSILSFHSTSWPQKGPYLP